MYDIHAHILPGIDDGAKTLEDAVAMAQVAAESGTSVILATPHRRDVGTNSSPAEIRRLVTEFNAELKKRGVGLDLVLGMENHLDLELPDDLLADEHYPLTGHVMSWSSYHSSGIPTTWRTCCFGSRYKG